MKGNEIRQKFIEYFEKNGHKPVHSSPLLPANDPTLLFVNAGMNQFKDVFLGNEKRDYTRAASSQKCIRAGGKHNDLDEVGKTARHHTFFEMLGNFSFGDYFKEDAINFAWDFLVNELGLAENRLWFSIFEGDTEVPADEEAEQLWIKAGAKPERVLRFGRKDNFWQMGDTGPCGPCSEIHYYMGDEPDNPEKNSPDLVNNDEGDTTMEIWNLVFMQFDRSEDGKGGFKLANLPAPSVDTGMGLERIAAVMEGQMTNYETSLIKPIIEFVAKINEWEYKGTNNIQDDLESDKSAFILQDLKDSSMRIIADHARATAFSIADGILPSNEGRGYVLRKIMRRAIRQNSLRTVSEGMFFYKVTDFVVDLMKDAYPELETQRDFIKKIVQLEEKRFKNTLFSAFEKLKTPRLQDAIKTLVENAKLFESRVPNLQQSIAEKFAESKDSDAIKSLQQSIAESVKPLAKHDDAIKSLQQSIAESGAMKSLQQSIAESGAMKSLQQSIAESGAMKSLQQSIAESVKPLFENQEKLTESFKNFAQLYDTYGMPKDLIRIEIEENGVEISEQEFNERFDEALQNIQSQGNIGKTQQNEKINPIYKSLEDEGFASNFHGYELTKVEDAKVVAIVKGDEKVDELGEGEEGLIVLDETPFYAESGGQVGDRGTIVVKPLAVSSVQKEKTADRSPLTAHVLDTFAPIAGIVLHKSKVKSGTIKVGDVVTATVDIEKRDATRRNHTATHLVHSALKEVLGTHVKQAGSVVSPNYLRFDFTHYQAMSDAELQEIEDLVNLYILQNEPVATDLMSIDEAMKTGAVAMFGEKYGSDVRVLSVGNGEFSKELCGGTHVRATGDIGSFKITADEAIASGVRRIRAITGFDAFKRFRDDEILIDESLNVLNTQRDNLPNAIAKLQDELKQKRKEVDELKLKIATGAIGGSSSDDEAKEVNGVKVFAKSVEDLDKGGMRHLSDTLMAKVKSGVVIIGNKNDGKVSFIVRVSDDLTKKVRAGNIIKEIAPIVGGKGGGRPDMAEGGGTEPDNLSEAMDASYGVIEKMLE